MSIDFHWIEKLLKVWKKETSDIFSTIYNYDAT
jgi:hypothetical protein